MLRYILRKLAYGIVVLLLVVLTISSIIYLSPVDPATLTQGQRTDTQTVEAVQKQYGLDQPLHVQLGRYLRDISPIDILNSNTFTNEKYSFIPLIPVGNEKYFSLKLILKFDSFLDEIELQKYFLFVSWKLNQIHN